jgi:DNA-directed RNA polymerase subunit RPC12/RpoP
MIKLIHCPFCGGEYFLFGRNENFKHDEPVTCPDCNTVIILSHLERYKHLKAQRI